MLTFEKWWDTAPWNTGGSGDKGIARAAWHAGRAPLLEALAEEHGYIPEAVLQRGDGTGPGKLCGPECRVCDLLAAARGEAQEEK